MVADAPTRCSGPGPMGRPAALSAASAWSGVADSKSTSKRPVTSELTMKPSFVAAFIASKTSVASMSRRCIVTLPLPRAATRSGGAVFFGVQIAKVSPSKMLVVALSDRERRERVPPEEQLKTGEEVDMRDEHRLLFSSLVSSHAGRHGP